VVTVGIRNRNVYAPRRVGAKIDWEAQQAESDRARAAEARVAEQARQAAAEARGAIDPLDALVRRMYALEQRVESLETSGRER
jgi:hypothetical protein